MTKTNSSIVRADVVKSLGANWHSYDSISLDSDQIKTDSDELIRDVIELVSSSALEGAPVAIAGAHAYDRKGYYTQDKLGGPRNQSYGRKGDDVVLQVTVRVPFEKAAKIVEAVTSERIAREEAAIQKKREEIDARIAQLQAERESL